MIKHLARLLLTRRVRPHTIRGGPLRGSVIVTSLHDYPGAILGYTEAGLLRWFQENVRSGETWVDVGAHYGYTAIALAQRVRANGRVFAFEPVLTTAGHLNTTKVSNGLDWLTVVPLGLGQSTGLSTASVPIDRGMAQHSSLGRGTTQIWLVRFDEVWPLLSRNEPIIHGVKVDVQGAEYDVIAGMREHLAQWRPRLVVEFHYGVSREEFTDLLASIGYVREGIAVDGRQAGPPYLDDHSYVFNPEVDSPSI